MDDGRRLYNASDEPEFAKTPQALRDRDLVIQFESLGGSGHGCEFGLFQRHFGAEPLGLLWWADLGHDLLINALESHFDGVGLVENTIVFNPEGSDEWWTKDTHHWMAMRSFVKTADVNLEQMTIQICRRLKFLRQKLIGDLEVGEKIFTYKNMFRNLTDTEVARLHAAVRSYGNSTLFYIRYADEAHLAGTVEAKAAGLLIGYMEHFTFSPDNKLIRPVNDEFLALCERAYQIHKGMLIEATPDLEIPSARKITRPARPRRVVLIGNCQMQAMMHLYNRFVAGRTGDVLEHVVSYEDLTQEGQALIEQADVVVEQLFDLNPQADTTTLSTNTPRLFIPMVTGAFLWPFAGQPHPKNQNYPFLRGGPYGGEAADSYLNRLILAGVEPEEAVETYANLDVNSRVKLDRLYELVIDRQRSRDEAAGYRISEVIEQHFQTEQIFLSPYHPNVRVSVALAAQFFEQLGAERTEIDRMRHCTRITPFPKGELPLHPDVCRHYGLDFIAPDRRYRFMNEGLFTFREYALRYMRYEWNLVLEEGISLAHAGNHDAAREKLQAGLGRSPRSAAGQNALSHVLGQTGLADEAIVAARRAVEIEPDFPPYRANLGNFLRKAGQLDEAEVELRAAVSANPIEPHNLVLLAHLLRQRGKIEEGIGLILRAIEADPYSTKLRLEQVDFSEASGNLDGALGALREAIALEPKSATLHHRLAHFLGRQNLIKDAIEAARQAVALEPKTARHRVALSDLLLREGRTEDALIEAYSASISESNSANAYGHLGHVLRLTGDHAASEAAFRHAARLEPHNAHVRHELSVLLNQQQRFEEAIAAAREATELEAGNPHRFVHLAHLLVQRNDLPGAQAAQRQAVRLQPEIIAFRVVLSDLFARDGKLTDALAEAHIAVERHPGSAHALGHLAHVTQIMGDFARAEGILREAISIEPHNDHLKQQAVNLASRTARFHEVFAAELESAEGIGPKVGLLRG